MLCSCSFLMLFSSFFTRVSYLLCEIAKISSTIPLLCWLIIWTVISFSLYNSFYQLCSVLYHFSPFFFFLAALVSTSPIFSAWQPLCFLLHVQQHSARLYHTCLYGKYSPSFSTTTKLVAISSSDSLKKWFLILFLACLEAKSYSLLSCAELILCSVRSYQWYLPSLILTISLFMFQHHFQSFICVYDSGNSCFSWTYDRFDCEYW